jgi:hypothetical protein
MDRGLSAMGAVVAGNSSLSARYLGVYAVIDPTISLVITPVDQWLTLDNLVKLSKGPSAGAIASPRKSPGDGQDHRGGHGGIWLKLTEEHYKKLTKD